MTLYEQLRGIEREDVSETNDRLMQAIKEYSSNIFIAAAILGEGTIEKIMRELSVEKNHGKWRFIPWDYEWKNGEQTYENRIRQMGQLIDVPKHLYPCSPLMPNNFFTSLLLLGITLGPIFTAINNVSNSAPITPMMQILGYSAVALFLGKGRIINRINPSLEQAKYLDAKINSLYGT